MNNKLIKLTEQDLHKIINESVHKILEEGDEITRLYQDTPTNHGDTIGEHLADVIHKYCQNDKRDFVPCVAQMIYNQNNQQFLQAVGQGFVRRLFNIIKEEHPEFYQKRTEIGMNNN